MDAWRTGLPWAVINSCIDNESFDYDAGPEAKELFEYWTQHCWDSLQDSKFVEIKCPKCDNIHEVPWTGWDNQSAWRKNSNGDYCGEHDATGYADKGFAISCKCSNDLHETTHGVLRAQKFRRDCEALRHHDIPMQGTCLDNNGETPIIPAIKNPVTRFSERLNCLRSSRSASWLSCKGEFLPKSIHLGNGLE